MATVTRPFFASLGDDFAFALVIFGVENLVRDAFLTQEGREKLVLLDRDSAHEHRLAFFMELSYRARKRLEFALLGLKNKIILVDAHDRLVGGYFGNLQAVHF